MPFLRALGVGLVQAVLFGVLAIAVTDGVPVTVEARPEEGAGRQPVQEMLGGASRLGLSVSFETLNGLLDSDELTKEGWTDLVVQGFTAEEEEDDDLLPPDEWPFQGKFSFPSRPAITLASAAGVEVVERRVENRILGTVDPLRVKIGRSRAAFFLVAVIPFLAAALLRGLRIWRSSSTVRQRLARGLGGGLCGLALMAAYLPVALKGVPTLTGSWGEFHARLLAAGRIEPTDLLTRTNVIGAVELGGAYLAASIVAGVFSGRARS